MSCCAPCLGVEIQDHTALAGLAAEWEALLQRSYDNRVFLTPIWHRLWWDHFGRGSAHVLLVRDEDRALQAVLPLQTQQERGERVLSLLGDPEVADYMDAAADKQHAQRLLTLLWRCALTELSFDRIELRHVPSTSPLLAALNDAASERGLEIAIQQDEVCPVALLCTSWKGYLEMLTKKQRHEIRRKLRRAQEGVEWHWRTALTPEDLDRDLPIFFRLHEASGRDKARFMTPDMRSFFQTIASVFLDMGILRLSVFQREGVDVAASISFLYRDRYLLYNSGYDPAFAAYNPGIAAVAHSMEDAIAAHAVAFDFLSGNEPYKYQFGASNTYTCRTESSSPRH